MPLTYKMNAIQLDLFTGNRIETTVQSTINDLYTWCDNDNDEYMAEDDLGFMDPCATCELKEICTDGECACNPANYNLLGTRYSNLEQYIQELKMQGWWYPAKSYIVKH